MLKSLRNTICRFKIKILIALIIVITILTCSRMAIKKYSIYNALDYYGFSTKEQKKSLESLMQKASILAPGQKLGDKFPTRHEYKELVKDILEFVTLCQRHFTIRSGYQERWEVKHPAWTHKNQRENFEDLKILGMVDEVSYSKIKGGALCVLGGIMPRIQNRINYANSMVLNGFKAGNLILLTGERYVTIGVDGTREELQKIAKNQNLSIDKLTETQLMIEAYQNSNLDKKLPIYVIDNKAGDLPRPTTQSTILELIEWLKTHQEVNNITFISNQPYVKYQAAIIKEMLRSHDSKINIEVVGSAAVFKQDQIQLFVGALGSYIWAQTPLVLQALGQPIDGDEILGTFKNLYKNQPLIYQNTEYLFQINKEK